MPVIHKFPVYLVKCHVLEYQTPWTNPRIGLCILAKFLIFHYVVDLIGVTKKFVCSSVHDLFPIFWSG